jgi:hypothetical protein
VEQLRFDFAPPAGYDDLPCRFAVGPVPAFNATCCQSHLREHGLSASAVPIAGPRPGFEHRSSVVKRTMAFVMDAAPVERILTDIGKPPHPPPITLSMSPRYVCDTTGVAEAGNAVSSGDRADKRSQIQPVESRRSFGWRTRSITPAIAVEVIPPEGTITDTDPALGTLDALESSLSVA